MQAAYSQIKDEVEKFDAVGTRYSKIILLRHYISKEYRI